MAQTAQTLIEPGLPSPEGDRSDGISDKEASDAAKETREFHWNGLKSRRLKDLTAEKYLLHVDGEGGAQYYDLYYGQRLKIPANLSGIPRIQNNQLRPIIDNYVAHLTTQPYRFVVEGGNDRRNRETALIDQALINHLVRRQRWNAVWTEAKYMACCTGFCPVHAAWRDDMSTSPYEAIAATDNEGNPMAGPKPGSIDSWVGNPFDHVFNAGARRYSVHRQTYGRVLPAEMVRTQFGRTDITGNDRQPSASTWQRTVQKWTQASSMVHGSSIMTRGYGHEELVGLIYDEILPGVDSRYPEGRLQIVALQGLSGTTRDDGTGALGEAKLLWTGPLPARIFSSVNVYSHHRHDDPAGKPFVADLDDDQIQLNQLESLVNEYVRRASRPPLASTGKVNVETISYRGDTVLEVEPLGTGSVELNYLEYPGRHIVLLGQKIDRVLDSMYRKGGWQAASRGEMKGSGKAIIALQQADDSIFGPLVMRTREELEEYAQLSWRLSKEFMDVPDIIDVVGDEMAHLVDPYIDRTQLSDRPPIFTLVSGFGTSMEAKAQQLMNMFGMVDQTGEQVLGTRELRKNWPDNSLFKQVGDPAEVRERRPRIINASIRKAAKMFYEQNPEAQFQGLGDPMLEMVAQQITAFIDYQHMALMDDDLEHHIETLSVITQDETEDPLTRKVAILRQQQFWMWLAEKQAAQQEQEQAEEEKPRRAQTAGASTVQSGGGTVNSESMMQADKQFEKQVRSA